MACIFVVYKNQLLENINNEVSIILHIFFYRIDTTYNLINYTNILNAINKYYYFLNFPM